MVDPVLLDCVAQRTHDVLLADHLAEGARAVAAIQRGRFGHGRPSLELSLASPSVRSVVAGAAAAVALALVLYAVFDGPQLVNYDTLYGIVWGRELAAGRTPELHVPFAPTPHPLLDGAAMGLAPLIGPPPPEYGDAAQGVVVAVALLALGAVGVLVFALGIPDRGTGARSWSATDCSSSSRSARASSARWPRSPRPSAPASRSR